MTRWDAAAGVYRGATGCPVCKSYTCLGDPVWCERERAFFGAPDMPRTQADLVDDTTPPQPDHPAPPDDPRQGWLKPPPTRPVALWETV